MTGGRGDNIWSMKAGLFYPFVYVDCFMVHSYHNQFADSPADCFRGLYAIFWASSAHFSTPWNQVFKGSRLVSSQRDSVQLAPFPCTICFVDCKSKCSLCYTRSKYYGSDSCVHKSLPLCWPRFMVGVTVLIVWEDTWFVLWNYTVQNLNTICLQLRAHF